MGRRRKYTDDELLGAMRDAATRLGRVPYKGETGPSATAYVYRFGSWARAVKAAGLTPRRRQKASRQGASPASYSRAQAVARAALTRVRRVADQQADRRLYWLARDPSLRSAS